MYILRDLCIRPVFVERPTLDISCVDMKLKIYLVEVTSFSASKSTSSNDFISSSDAFDLVIVASFASYAL